jgi:hypothetical protein
MADRLTDYLKDRQPKEFVSRPLYFKEGDFVSYFLEDCPYLAERVDELLTVYRAMDDKGRLVGCKIKGVRKLQQRMGEFGFAIVNTVTKRILLGPLFLGGLALAENPSLQDSSQRRSRYEEICHVAKDAWLEAGEFQSDCSNTNELTEQA